MATAPQRIQPGSPAQLQELLGYVPLFPYPGLLTDSEMTQLLSHRVADWLGNPDVHTFWRPGTVAAWRPLPWDSRQFGFPAARIEFAAKAPDAPFTSLADCFGELLEHCAANGIRHVTARASTSDLTMIHALEAHGFQLLDGIQTFGLRVSNFPEPHSVDSLTCGDVRICLFEPQHLDSVLALAAEAYQYDRFHADSALSSSIADQLYREWLRNSCSGTAADALFVAARGREVLSYVTVSIDREVEALTGKKLATIVLVATSEKARGQGLAKRTTLYTLEWLKAQRCDAVTVGTQLRNVPAGRLYESCGFRLTATSLTFRKLFATKG